MKRKTSEDVFVNFERIDAGFRPPRLNSLKVKSIFSQLLKKEKLSKAVNVVFTDNSRIKRLNKLYRYRDIATDVLSFEYGKDAELLGEIIVSLETAKIQAEKYGNSFTMETLVLLIHGFYHILGYKHYRKNDHRAMKKKEQSAMKFLIKKGLVR